MTKNEESIPVENDIPSEVVEALAKSMGCEWTLQSEEDRAVLVQHIVAVLYSWPNMIRWVDGLGRPLKITLPIQQK